MIIVSDNKYTKRALNEVLEKTNDGVWDGIKIVKILR